MDEKLCLTCSGEPHLSSVSSESLVTHPDTDHVHRQEFDHAEDIIPEPFPTATNITTTLQDLPTEILSWTFRRFLTFKQVANLRLVSIHLERIASSVLRVAFLNLSNQVNTINNTLLQREYLLISSIFARQLMKNFVPPAAILDEFTRVISATKTWDEIDDNPDILAITSRLHRLNAKIMEIFEERFMEPFPSRLIQMLYACSSTDYQLIMTRDKSRCHIIGHFTFPDLAIAPLPGDYKALHKWFCDLRLTIHEWNRESGADLKAPKERLFQHIYDLSENKTRSLNIRQGPLERRGHSRMIIEICCPIDEAPICILEPVSRRKATFRDSILIPDWLRDNSNLTKQNLFNIHLL